MRSSAPRRSRSCGGQEARRGLLAVPGRPGHRRGHAANRRARRRPRGAVQAFASALAQPAEPPATTGAERRPAGAARVTQGGAAGRPAQPMATTAGPSGSTPRGGGASSRSCLLLAWRCCARAPRDRRKRRRGGSIGTSRDFHLERLERLARRHCELVRPSRSGAATTPSCSSTTRPRAASSSRCGARSRSWPRRASCARRPASSTRSSGTSRAPEPHGRRPHPARAPLRDRPGAVLLHAPARAGHRGDRPRAPRTARSPPFASARPTLARSSAARCPRSRRARRRARDPLARRAYLVRRARLDARRPAGHGVPGPRDLGPRRAAPRGARC